LLVGEEHARLGQRRDEVGVASRAAAVETVAGGAGEARLWTAPGPLAPGARPPVYRRVPAGSSAAHSTARWRDHPRVVVTSRRAAHFNKASSAGQRAWPQSVRQYSTFGGTWW